MSTTWIKVDGQYTTVRKYMKKINNVWSAITEAELISSLSDNISFYGGQTELVLSINGPSSISGTSGNYILLANHRQVIATWQVISGGQYATIDNTGALTVLTGASESPVTIRAIYLDQTETKDIIVSYNASSSTETEVEVITDESGNTTTTVVITTENEDGSSQVETNVVVTDESGNTIGSQETSTNNNADGSYDSTSTTYDENGDPTETTNVSGDTAGNVSTQGIEYDESGTSAVTAYTIDTSGNPDGEKTYNGDGVNTEYYAFDVTRGFVVHIHFYINFTQQPAGQDENHHNILTTKRATPTPWYGFQLRQTGTNKYVQLGTQFSTGNNTNTQIASAATASANTAEYDLTITYNPTASTNSFVCRNNLTSTNVYTSNNKFPDIDDLKYIKVTVGYAMDANGDAFRYSNIKVLDFSIQRIN